MKTRPVDIRRLVGPPVVGERYFVPTVEYVWCDFYSHWPVMGPRHEDREHIGFGRWHYHVDLRFLTRAEERAMLRQNWSAVDIPTTAAAAVLVRPWGEGDLPHPAVRPQVRRCRHAGHEYPLARARAAKNFQAMFAAHAGKACGRDRGGRPVCPHKGFDLSTIAPDADGLITCPLHGLRIDPVNWRAAAFPDGYGEAA